MLNFGGIIIRVNKRKYFEKSYLQLPIHPSLPFHPWAPGPPSPLWGPEALANLALLLRQTDLSDPKI